MVYGDSLAKGLVKREVADTWDRAGRLALSTPMPTNSRAGTYKQTIKFARKLANGRAIVEFEAGEKKNRVFHQTMGNLSENGYLILAGIQVAFRSPEIYQPYQLPIMGHPHFIQRMVQTLGDDMVKICRVWGFHAAAFAMGSLNTKADGDTVITASDKLMVIWRPSEEFAQTGAWEAITVISSDKLDGSKPKTYAEVKAGKHGAWVAYDEA